MKEYTINGLSTSGTGPHTCGTIIGSATIRGLLNYFLFGLRTAPNATDQQIRCAISNTTTTGTAGSNPTPKPRDPQDIAAVATAGITHSAEPTLGANFLDFDINQRASKEWACEYGKEIAGAATASNTVSSRMVSSTAAIVASCVMGWRE